MKTNDFEIIKNLKDYAKSGRDITQNGNQITLNGETIKTSKSSLSSTAIRYTRSNLVNTNKKNKSSIASIRVDGQSVFVSGDFDEYEIYKIPDGYTCIYQSINKNSTGQDDIIINLVLHQNNSDNYKFCIVGKGDKTEKDIELKKETIDSFKFKRFENILFQHGILSGYDIGEKVTITERQSFINSEAGFKLIIKRNDDNYFFDYGIINVNHSLQPVDLSPIETSGSDLNITYNFEQNIQNNYLITKLKKITSLTTTTILEIKDEIESSQPTYTYSIEAFPKQASEDDDYDDVYIYCKVIPVFATGETIIEEFPNYERWGFGSRIIETYIETKFPKSVVDTLYFIEEPAGLPVRVLRGTYDEMVGEVTIFEPFQEVNLYLRAIDYIIIPAWKNRKLNVRDFSLTSKIESYFYFDNYSGDIVKDIATIGFNNSDIPPNSVLFKRFYSSTEYIQKNILRKTESILIEKESTLEPSTLLNISSQLPDQTLTVIKGVGKKMIDATRLAKTSQYMLKQDHGYPINSKITDIITDPDDLYDVGDTFLLKDLTIPTTEPLKLISEVVANEFVTDFNDIVCIGDLYILEKEFVYTSTFTVSSSLTNNISLIYGDFSKAEIGQIISNEYLYFNTLITEVLPDKTGVYISKPAKATVTTDITLTGEYLYKLNGKSFLKSILYVPTDLYSNTDERYNKFVFDISLGKPNLIGETLYLVTKINSDQTAECLTVDLSTNTPVFSIFDVSYIGSLSFNDISVIE